MVERATGAGASAAAAVIDVSTRGADDDTERFERFRSCLCDVYLGIRPARASPLPFVADVLAYPVGGGVLSRMRAPGHIARRDGRSIAADGDDAIFLNVAAETRSWLEQSGDETSLRAGQPVLIDNARPFRLVLDPARRFRLYTLRMPRRLGPATLSASDVSALNRRLAGPDGVAVAEQARLLYREFDEGRMDVAAAMAGAVRAQLQALLTDRPRPPGAEDAAGDPFDAVTRFASAHLDDPGFDLGALARGLGRSQRTIQSVFADAGQTWSAWALAARLERARERLCSPAWRDRSVARIAAASGFRDPSHFHRAFRDRFGASPGTFRPGR